MTRADARRELEVDAAVLAIAAGLIHAVVAVTHASEYWLFSVFFAALGAGQIAWGAFVYRGAERRVLVAGAWANAGVVLLWLFTRVVAVPLGPDAGSRESVGVLDAIATLDELVVVAMVLALVRFPQLRPRLVRAAGRVGPVVGMTLAMASLLVLTLGVHAH